MRWLRFRWLSWVLWLVGIGIVGLGVGVLIIRLRPTAFHSPFSLQPTPPPRPLLAYTISALRERAAVSSPVTITRLIDETPEIKRYLFTFHPLGRMMSGVLTLPADLTTPGSHSARIIVMLRGYVPAEQYVSGVGTKNAAIAYARAGFVTFAPDFFGYGESDPEPSDVWQARFEKPAIVTDLLTSLKAQPVQVATGSSLTASSIGLWGHSNGGQIALTALEILPEPIPTVLWAPVSVPFPYSILFFTDENEDEGKAARKWLAEFEKTYDVFDFSLTDHLHYLQGPIQWHHGTADEAALKTWSDEFMDKVKAENQRRREATDSAELSPIDITYYTYPGADHNLRPGWDTAVERDITFYQQWLKL